MGSYVRQPGYVVFALIQSGGLVSVIFACLIPVVLSGYRQAERRKITARNL